MKKDYCKCISPDSFQSLWDAFLEKWSDVFVCSKCLLPTREVWEGHIGTCEDCFSEFSFPETLYGLTLDEGEYLCLRCHLASQRTGDVTGPYRGWEWAAGQRPSWDIRPEVLDRKEATSRFLVDK